jgi:protease I
MAKLLHCQDRRRPAPQSFHPKDHIMEELKGLRVAVLATNGFEQSELLLPRKALDEAGASTRVVSPEQNRIRGWHAKDWGQQVTVDVALDAANADEFDALLLPGGVMNPDTLRMLPKAVAFVKAFCDAGKPVAAICHGPWTVLEAGAARGRRMTSWPSLKTDLTNAGATWVDEEVVVDGNLVTSRKADDIPAFNRAINQEFGKARQGGRRAR